jgi:hypothetical protein
MKSEGTNLNRKVKIGIWAIVLIVTVPLAAVIALIYLRTGHYLYSEENLAKCQKFTPEQAKIVVLRSRLKNYHGWSSEAEAWSAAQAAQITFLDGEIHKTDSDWFIPFTQTNTENVKQYFAMLDCGTLTVEYAAEPEEPPRGSSVSP